MAQAEDEAKRLFWRPLMGIKMIVASALLALWCFHSSAKSFDEHKHTPGVRNANEQTAQSLVEEYYDYLKIGTSLKKVSSYWSDLKARDFKDIAQFMSARSGRSLDLEIQHLLYVAHMQAKCESLSLRNAETSGLRVRRAELHYTVENTCVDWKEEEIRTFRLVFSLDERRWLIDSIVN